jgi:hypothetical protein
MAINRKGKSMNKLFTLSAGLLFSTVSAFAMAQAITPDAAGFGALPTATFGGSGIPNSAVAQTTQGGVTLGLTATQRFSNPTVTNDGAGTFFALAGIDTNAPSPGNPYALWNFNYAILGDWNAAAAYNYRLYYDFSPTIGNSISTHGFATLIGGALDTNDFTPSQNSLNLGMNFLAPPSPSNPFGNPTAPPGSNLSTFDPNAIGQYTFKLAAFSSTDLNFSNSVFDTSMVVVSAIPEPGEWAMMLAGLGVVGAIARRRRNK